MQLRKRGFVGQITDAVTEREAANRKLARRAAAEGFVLLKNEGHLLPLKKNTKVGLYGAGASRTIKGGTGSGDVNERDCVNIYQGMLNAGFEVTSGEWLSSYENLYTQARLDWKETIFRKMKEKQYENDFFAAYSTTQFQMPGGEPLDVEKAKADGAKTAIFVLSRVAGENADRHDVKGDYYVTDEEMALLTQISDCYKDVILVINTGGLIDLAFTERFPNIRSILQFMQAGQEGGNAFADVICGDVTPSGKMTDTWALDYNDYPNASYFSFKSKDVYKEEYKEDIYVGYRYFDTFDVPVRYCFGYGLSYTDFEIVPGEISVKGLGTEKPMVSVKVLVKNVGNIYAGKEVVQIYVSCPQGRMPKEYRRLAGFGKTEVLRPGQSQDMEIDFALEQLASYNEEQAAWILEEGVYGIWIGNSLENAVLAGSLKLDADALVMQCGHICVPKKPLETLVPDLEKMQTKAASWMGQAAKLPSIAVKASEIITKTAEYSSIADELPGKAGEITKSLSLEQLVAFATGDIAKGQGSALGSAGQTVPGAAAETVAVAEAGPWNVASIVLADGPAGLRLNRTYQVLDGVIMKADFVEAFEGGFFASKKEPEGDTYYQYCTAIPVGTLLAQTWNINLIQEVGEMIGHEMELFEVTLWLAPGMNIHRNPLCGRNFEYYSEDPLLSGIMASAMTLGVQKVPGCGTTIKHFACNNQEDNRMGSDSVLSERALREIYLKGFEIAVKNAQPMSIMTSYNLINGVHAANCYDICTKAARDEWGFRGVIMTDWTTTTASTAGICTAAGCIRAGNDMVMPGDLSDHESIRKELDDGTLDIRELKRCVCNTINIVLQSNQYEEKASYLEQFEDLGSYMTAAASF